MAILYESSSLPIRLMFPLGVVVPARFIQTTYLSRLNYFIGYSRSNIKENKHGHATHVRIYIIQKMHAIDIIQNEGETAIPIPP